MHGTVMRNVAQFVVLWCLILLLHKVPARTCAAVGGRAGGFQADLPPTLTEVGTGIAGLEKEVIKTTSDKLQDNPVSSVAGKSILPAPTLRDGSSSNFGVPHLSRQTETEVAHSSVSSATNHRQLRSFFENASLKTEGSPDLVVGGLDAAPLKTSENDFRTRRQILPGVLFGEPTSRVEMKFRRQQAARARGTVPKQFIPPTRGQQQVPTPMRRRKTITTRPRKTYRRMPYVRRYYPAKCRGSRCRKSVVAKRRWPYRTVYWRRRGR